MNIGYYRKSVDLSNVTLAHTSSDIDTVGPLYCDALSEIFGTTVKYEKVHIGNYDCLQLWLPDCTGETPQTDDTFVPVVNICFDDTLTTFGRRISGNNVTQSFFKRWYDFSTSKGQTSTMVNANSSSGVSFAIDTRFWDSKGFYTFGMADGMFENNNSLRICPQFCVLKGKSILNNSNKTAIISGIYGNRLVKFFCDAGEKAISLLDFTNSDLNSCVDNNIVVRKQIMYNDFIHDGLFIFYGTPMTLLYNTQNPNGNQYDPLIENISFEGESYSEFVHLDYNSYDKCHYLVKV